MEYSSAGDLVMWSESLGGLQGIPKRERMGLAADAAEALAAIHEIGIVHGDLRPEAVLVEEHQDEVSARLTGFGRGHLQDATVGGAGEITVWDLLFEDGLIREPTISNQWLDPDASRAYFDADGRRLVVVGGSSSPTKAVILCPSHWNR